MSAADARRSLFALLAAIVLVACSAAGVDEMAVHGAKLSADGRSESVEVSASTGGQGGAEDVAPKGGSAGAPAAGGAVAMGGTAGTAAITDLPCAVASLVESKCAVCHGEEPKGAPMSLVTRADWLAPSKEMPGDTMGESALARMKDASSPMPPAGHPAATAEEIAAVMQWIDAGTPKETCAPAGSGGAGGKNGGAAPFPGASAGGSSGSGGSTGSAGSGDGTCGLTSGSASCNACFVASCCAQGEACRNDPTCNAALACLSACDPGDGSCESTCALQLADGNQAFLDVLHCVQNVCADDCGGGGGDVGSAGSAGSTGGGGSDGAGSGTTSCLASGATCSVNGLPCCAGSCDASTSKCK